MNFATISRALLAEKPEVIVSGQKRIQSLDMIKLLSFIGVLAIHCASELQPRPWGYDLWTIRRFVCCCGVISIPMFFLVSGYMLLGREKSGYAYAFRKIYRLLRASFVLYVLVLLLKWLIWGEDVMMASVPRRFSLNLLQTGDYCLLWFVGAMCIVYLVYPLINKVYRKKDVAFLWLCVFLVGLMTFFFFFNFIWPRIGCLREFAICQTFRLWNWIGYFCLGGLVKRYRVFDRLGRLPLILVLFGICFLMLNAFAVWRGLPWVEYGYSSMPVMVLVVAVFSYVMRLNIYNPLMSELAGVFLPAYLLGPIFMYMLVDHMLLLPEWVGTLVFVAANAVLALAAGWLLMKIPGVGKLLRL